MRGRLRLVGVGAVCLAIVAVVPGALAAPPASPGQPPVVADAPQGAAAVQSEWLPSVPLNPYVPPACTGVFTDVACPGGFAVNWIEKFYADGITAGCNAAPLQYCPDATVTRAQMAVFVEKAMRGTGAWTPGDLGNGNTGLGAHSVFANTTGAVNTGLGDYSLWANTTGDYNVGVGANSLGNNTSASQNVAVGFLALSAQSYDPGSAWTSYNTAVGTHALQINMPTSTSNGIRNTAVGANSLQASTTGFDNTAVGMQAGARGGDVITGYTGSPATFVNTVTGSYNTFVGIAGSTADVSNCTAVGMDAYCDASDQVRLGNTYVTSIGGKVGFSALSDARAKTDIRDLDLGLDFVLGLRPVSYHLRGGNGRTDMGFVAQDVEALLGDEYNVLGIGGDAERTLSLRYTDLIAPMVKAIQEQQATIAELRAKLAERDAHQAEMEALVARVARLEAALPPR